MPKLGGVKVNRREKVVVKTTRYRGIKKVTIRLHKRKYGRWKPTEIWLKIEYDDTEKLIKLFKKGKEE